MMLFRLCLGLDGSGKSALAGAMTRFASSSSDAEVPYVFVASTVPQRGGRTSAERCLFSRYDLEVRIKHPSGRRELRPSFSFLSFFFVVVVFIFFNYYSRFPFHSDSLFVLSSPLIVYVVEYVKICFEICTSMMLCCASLM